VRFDHWADDANQKLLTELELFKGKLSTDIRDGIVFPAFRQRNICFYANGRKLFDFDGKKFKTHPAFAIAYETEPEENYVDEEKLKTLKLSDKFVESYEQIKRNTKLYLGPESAAVAKFCERFSCFKSDIQSEVVVLDVELSLESLEKKGKRDQIDLVLLNQKEKKIRFFEVKLFGDERLRPKKDKPAEVVGQLERYNMQIRNEKVQGELLAWYQQYIEILNSVFKINLCRPDSLDESVDLLLWGADKAQWNSFEKTKKDIEDLEGESYASWIKDVSNVKDTTLTSKWWQRRR